MTTVKILNYNELTTNNRHSKTANLPSLSTSFSSPKSQVKNFQNLLQQKILQVKFKTENFKYADIFRYKSGILQDDNFIEKYIVSRDIFQNKHFTNQNYIKVGAHEKEKFLKNEVSLDAGLFSWIFTGLGNTDSDGTDFEKNYQISQEKNLQKLHEKYLQQKKFGNFQFLSLENSKSKENLILKFQRILDGLMSEILETSENLQISHNFYLLQPIHSHIDYNFLTQEILSQISISQNLEFYVGQPKITSFIVSPPTEYEKPVKIVGNYCDLNFGFVVSKKLLKNLQENFDVCLENLEIRGNLPDGDLNFEDLNLFLGQSMDGK